MPEGDTIFHLAERLRPVLVGRSLHDVYLREVPGAPRLEGAEVTAVRAVGKHLLIHVSRDGEPDRILRTHLGMDGRWRILAQPGPRDPALRVVMRAGEDGPELRLRDAPQVEVFLARDEGRHPALRRLGPDLLDTHDLDEVVRRARARGADDLAALLLDQGVAAGIGNVYKCELLFRAGLSPWTAPAAVGDATLRGLYADAAKLLAANARRSRRVTTLGPKGARARVHGIDHFVYGRVGKPCVACRAPVRVARQGPQLRPTYWCPGCQPRAPRPDSPSPPVL